MMMAVHLTMCRSGEWPERITAAAWGLDNVLRARADVLVRPADGEHTTTVPQVLAERAGLDGDDVRCVLRLIGGRSAGVWTGLVSVSRMLLVHDIDETDRRIRAARIAFGMSPEWRRPSMIPQDTAAGAMLAMKLDRRPSLEEATAALVGEPIAGVDGILALFNRPAVQAAIKRVAA